MELTSNLNVILLAADGVSRADLAGAREALEKAGVKVAVASPSEVEVKAWDRNDWSNRIRIDTHVKSVVIEEYQGLVIPGGPLHADELRLDADAVKLVKHFFSAGKTLGAIGHGVQLLIEAGALKDRKVTGPRSLRTDLELAGAIWQDTGVAVDNGLVSCQSETHLAEFNPILLEKLRQGISQRSVTII